MLTVFQAMLAQVPTAAAPALPLPGSWWVVLIPGLPLLGVLLATFCAMGRVKSKLPAWLSVACLAAAFAVTVAMYLQATPVAQDSIIYRWFDLHWGAKASPAPGEYLVANFGFYIDSLTCFWMLFVTGLATLIGLYASEYMAGDLGAGYCRFFVAFNLFVFSMACLVMADNLILLYLGWEGVGLCSYLLIGYFYKKPAAVAAAKKAFIVNRIGDLGLALGIALTFVKFGTLEYGTLLAADGPLHHYLDLAREGNWSEIPFQVQLIAFLFMAGAFGKSAQLPLYVWLPDAMEGPTPVSALIHAATMVTAGVFLIARTYPVFLISEHALPTVAWVGTATALLAATIGMAQFDIKRIMAYSTVSQLGYMFAGLGVFTSIGGAFHVFTHAFFKALLFLACGAVMHGFAGQLDLRRLSGLQKIRGWQIVGWTMLIGCLNLAGFPLITGGFWSKDMIMATAFESPWSTPIGWVLLLTAGLTAYYTFRVYFRVFVGPEHFEPGDELHAHAGDDHTHDAHGHDHAHEPLPPKVQQERAIEAELANKAAAHDSHDHTHDAHDHFHPHAPGWAINLVLIILALGTFLGIWVNFTGPEAGHGGWAASMIDHSTAALPAEPAGEAPAATLFGYPPHQIMYWISAIVGIIGILIAAFLHGPVGIGGLFIGNRREASRSRADNLLPALGPIPSWAQHKWYVDEFYNFLIVIPLWVIANIFHMIDKFLVDGVVDLFGLLPRATGSALRPAQSGRLHGYAVAMAGGAAFLILIVLIAAWRTA